MKVHTINLEQLKIVQVIKESSVSEIEDQGGTISGAPPEEWITDSLVALIEVITKE